MLVDGAVAPVPPANYRQRLDAEEGPLVGLQGHDALAVDRELVRVVTGLRGAVRLRIAPRPRRGLRVTLPGSSAGLGQGSLAIRLVRLGHRRVLPAEAISASPVS